MNRLVRIMGKLSQWDSYLKAVEQKAKEREKERRLKKKQQLQDSEPQMEGRSLESKKDDELSCGNDHR